MVQQLDALSISPGPDLQHTGRAGQAWGVERSIAEGKDDNDSDE